MFIKSQLKFASESHDISWETGPLCIINSSVKVKANQIQSNKMKAFFINHFRHIDAQDGKNSFVSFFVYTFPAA